MKISKSLHFFITSFLIVGGIFLLSQYAAATACSTNFGCLPVGVCISNTCSSTTTCATDADCASAGGYCISQFCSGTAYTGYPTINFSATFVQNSTYNLSWSTTDATSCSASASPAIASWLGTQSLSGTQTLNNITTSTVLTLTCAGTSGAKSKSITATTSGSSSTNLSSDNNNCGAIGNVCPSGKTCVNGACTSSTSGTTTTSGNCDSSSFSSSSLAFDFGSTGGSKTSMCGSAQYFKIAIPSGKTCDLKWTLTPDSNSDYDLYIKDDSSLTRNVYDSRSVNNKGLVDELTKTGLSAGTYYALVTKESNTTGLYNMAASLLNCSGSTTTGTCTNNSNCASGLICVNSMCTSSSGSSTTGCDSSSLSQASSAFDFQSGGNKTNLCGDDQYFKIAIPSGKTCDLKWTLTPDSNSDYDLYIKDDSSLTRNVYTQRSVNGKGLIDELSRTGLPAGTYYALSHKESSTSGSYSIAAALANCSGVTNVNASITTNTTTSTTTNDITQLQNQINQLLTQIAQLQSDLAKMKSGQSITTNQQSINSSIWCHTFTAFLRYKDRSSEVGALQAALQKEGLFNRKPTDYFGQVTLSSVIAFQGKYKNEILTPANLTSGTGAVDSLTINKLNQLYGCK